MNSEKSKRFCSLKVFSIDYCQAQQNAQATSRVSIPHHTTSNTESKPWNPTRPSCCAYQLALAKWMLLSRNVLSERRAGSQADATRKIEDAGKSLSILMLSARLPSHPAQNVEFDEIRIAIHSVALRQAASSHSKPMLEYIRSWRNDIVILMNCLRI
jgi:hypothetical protein